MGFPRPPNPSKRKVWESKLRPSGTLSLEDLSQLLDNSVADLLSASVATQVLAAQAAIESSPHGVLDSLGLSREVEGVAQEHGHGQDRADGVDDALAGDIGGRACIDNPVSKDTRTFQGIGTNRGNIP